MLDKEFISTNLQKLAVCAALIALLANCGSSKVDEEIFYLYAEDQGRDDLISTLNSYSLRHDYRLKREVVSGSTPKTTSYHIMLEGNGIRVLFQSALSEKCKEREGRRDVEYSSRIYDVNAFNISNFNPNTNLSKEVKNIKEYLIVSGFRVVSKEESCSLL